MWTTSRWWWWWWGWGHGGAMEAISGLQTAHLPLSPIPAPSSPPQTVSLARGRGPFSSMLTRLAGSPGRPHSWPSGAMNSVLSTSSRGLYSLLRVGGRGGGRWGGGPGPAMLDVFPELGSHPGQGPGCSALCQRWRLGREDIFSMWPPSDSVPPCEP